MSDVLSTIFLACFLSAPVIALWFIISRPKLRRRLFTLFTPASGPAAVLIGGALALLGGNGFLGWSLIIAGVCSWLGRTVATPSRRDLGGLVGFLLGPIGVIVAAVLRDE